MDTELRDDLISAALDGERVDVEALRYALATPEGRSTLAAFVLLRAATAADDIPPAERHGDRVVVMKPRRTWPLTGARVPAVLASSIAIVAVAASFMLGTALRAPNTTLTVAAPPTAPATTPVPVILPAPTGPLAGDRQSQEGFRTPDGARVRRIADEPPTPTRVLRFVPGVDWKSTTE